MTLGDELAGKLAPVSGGARNIGRATARSLAALLGGHVNTMAIEPAEAGEPIRAGNLRVLAQVSDRRLPGFTEVPALKEAGFDLPAVPPVRGAPPGIPKQNVACSEDVFLKLARSESWRKFLDDRQFEDGYRNAAERARFYDAFTPRMRDILQDAGFKTLR
jgi:putative tricarboxylic transport membrane protein